MPKGLKILGWGNMYCASLVIAGVHSSNKVTRAIKRELKIKPDYDSKVVKKRLYYIQKSKNFPNYNSVKLKSQVYI